MRSSAKRIVTCDRAARGIRSARSAGRRRGRRARAAATARGARRRRVAAGSAAARSSAGLAADRLAPRLIAARRHPPDADELATGRCPVAVPWRRTATVPSSASRSPTTSMYGILRSSASRILRPTDSVRSSTSARSPAARSARGDRPRGLVVAVGDRQHDRLDRREPERELAGVVLDQDPDEALEGAHQRAVDHHRAVLGVVGAGVGELEALGHRCSRAGPCRAATSGRASRSCAGRSSGRRRRRRPR